MAKKAAPKAGESKPAAAKKAATKADIYAALAEKTGLTKKQVASVFESYNEWLTKELSKKGPGVALLPNMAKVKVVRKPATKAKEGRNPFTGQPMTIKAKPARNVVKFVPLKSLKDSV
jgi:nucleoid DNA-binding protein